MLLNDYMRTFVFNVKMKAFAIFARFLLLSAVTNIIARASAVGDITFALINFTIFTRPSEANLACVQATR